MAAISSNGLVYNDKDFVNQPDYPETAEGAVILYSIPSRFRHTFHI